jgi:integrase/recombinase XerD
MSVLLVAVHDYLALRRKLGFALKRDSRLLPDFVQYLQDAGAGHVTTELAVAWAMSPRTADPAWWRARLGIVRGFARYLAVIDPRTQIPPAGVLSARRRRVRPYLYSSDDIAALMAAARSLRPAWRAVVYETLIGLMATTGLRLGEALGLDATDFDFAGAVVNVRKSKRDNQRQVPLHHSTVEALHAYCQDRDRRWPQPDTPALFISMRGQRLGSGTVHDNFRHLATVTGLQGRGARRWPRPHDLRHSLAVSTLIDWHQAGQDVEAKLPLLSTFLGHVDPTATYWYLEAAPELLALVGHKLDHVLDTVLKEDTP